MNLRRHFQTAWERLLLLNLALSTPVVIAFSVTSLLLNVIFARVATHLTPLGVVTAGAVATLCGCGILLLLRPIVNSVLRQRNRTVIVLCALALASETRSIVNLAVMTFLEGARALDFDAPRVSIFGFMFVFGVSAGVAVAQSAAGERRQLTAALQSEQERLRSLTDSLESDLALAEVELRALAHNQLAPTVSEITALLDDELSDADARALSARISDAVSAVVRPVSHSLAAESPAVLPPHQSTVSNRRHLLSERMDVPKSIRPFWILATLWLLVAPGVILLGASAAVFAVTFLGSLVAALVLAGVARVWPKSARSLKIPAGLSVILLVLLIVQSMFQPVLTYGGFGALGPQWWTTFTWFGVPVRTALSMLVVVVGMYLDFGDQRRRDLVEVNGQLTAYIGRLRREMWLLRRSVSLAVHGPVQSAMVSTAMRLANNERSATSIDDARQRLERALRDISEGQSAEVDLVSRLDDLCELWNPVVRVTYTMECEAESRLRSDPGMQGCVLEVCRESVGNAIRHGGASQVTASVVERGGRVVVTVSDNGNGIPDGVVSGLGHTALDQICLQWHIENSPVGGAVLRATLV